MVATISREECLQRHNDLNIRLSEMHTDVKWIKSSIQNGTNWMSKHDEEHKGMVMKLVAAVTILTGAVAAFFGGMVK
jgi:hypothetical protein